tara:strand:- start:1092 stop:1613 length:522 start_codon:yes stop_codon:yes gene_type:complete
MARKIIGTKTAIERDKLINVTHFWNINRNSISTSSNGTLWTGSFTKLKDATESWILLDGMIPAVQNYSDQCGTFAELDGADTNNDAPRYEGIYYGGVNESNNWARFILQVHRIIKNDDSTQELGAGSRTWKIGWYPRNGSSGEKPFGIINPNSSDDARNNQYGSYMSVWEYRY